MPPDFTYTSHGRVFFYIACVRAFIPAFSASVPSVLPRIYVNTCTRLNKLHAYVSLRRINVFCKRVHNIIISASSITFYLKIITSAENT